MRSLLNLAVIVVVLTMSRTPLQAADDEEHLGAIEYEIACLPCHGANGRGDGEAGAALKVKPADLTGITRANGGTFPFAKVLQMVDGRAAVAAHGPRDMPVWGDRYRIAADGTETKQEIDSRARVQIEALVRYVQSLQR
jgi:hypothetical protein